MRGATAALAIGCAAAWAMGLQPVSPEAAGIATRDDGLARLAADAERVRPAVMTDAVKEWLDTASLLPPAPAARVWYEREGGVNRAFTESAFAALPEAERKGLRPYAVHSLTFYSTRYGTPMVYARVLDMVAQVAGPGYTLAGKRVVDLGYGQFGQLTMLALSGAVAIGVDVDPLLRALGELPGAQGVKTGEAGVNGLVTVVDGRWPGEDLARGLVGGEVDLVIARNVLKRGYVRPREAPDEWRRVDLGIATAEAPSAMRRAMRAGGYLVIYNIGNKPAADGEAYDPGTDIADPWTAEEWEAAGFEVVLHDEDESKAARIVGRLLGWGEGAGAMDLETDLFGRVTLLRAAE